ncbi:XRE family transcriptional regulator [Saccharothrix sp. S26]|uniref:helix-turn-helix domain-containing protein n=1 Tax=Saccharothrix sp. S26 TaxID=2907215 RepID=UPI001F2AA2B3|nr:XRE family transcriptional regulator [Saccharothrix sp. S26]MCE6993797.1 XRE family transcriptional regulator [Saccharothrix sp. S26]
MRIERNEALRVAREVAGLTQAQLADLANAQVEAATGRIGAMDADYVGKLERGVHRWPHRSYRDALRVVLDVATDRELGFFSTRSRLATVASPRHPEGGDDVERKAFLRVLAGSVMGVALTDPLAAFSAQAVGGTRRIGQAEVDHVRHLARMFASQDHQYGGGLSARAVVAQLAASAELTEGTFASTRVRDELFAAVAELADTAAGLCFDAGLHREAERAFRFSVGCATESGDWAMRAKARSGLANLSVHRGRAEDALDFAEMALVRADRLSPKVGAVVRTRHARALALSGTSRGVDCRAAIGKAGELFAASSGDEPPWLAYYDEAHLERDCGRALVHLALNGGDHGEARDRLTASIARFPEGHSRGKALAKANLAALMMARDDPRHAVELGHDAVESVGAVRSDRVNDALRQLVTAGHPHVHLPEVRELLHRVRLAVG